MNVQKSVTMLFSIISSDRLDDLVYDGLVIPWQQSVTYLGITLDSKLNFEVYTREILNKSIGQFWRLYLLPNGRSSLPIETKRLLYLALIRSIFVYTTQARAYEPARIPQLQRFQNRIFCSLLGAC